MMRSENIKTVGMRLDANLLDNDEGIDKYFVSNDEMGNVVTQQQLNNVTENTNNAITNINTAIANSNTAIAKIGLAKNIQIVLPTDIVCASSSIPTVRSGLFTFLAGKRFHVYGVLLTRSDNINTGVRFCAVDLSGNSEHFSFRNIGLGESTSTPVTSQTFLTNSSLGNTHVQASSSLITPNSAISTFEGIVSTFPNYASSLSISLLSEVEGSSVRILAGSLIFIKEFG